MVEPIRAVLNVTSHPRRWLTFLLLSAFILLVVGASIWLTVEYWTELVGKGADPSAVVRNVGLLTGGVIAVGLAIWRSSIAERQVEVSERRSLDEQFQRATEMLGHELEPVQIGGIASLRFLAHNHFFIYATRVHGILYQFAEGQCNPDQEAVISYRDQVYRGSTAGGEAFYAHMSIWDDMNRMSVVRGATRWTFLKAVWTGRLTGYMDAP
ncbi:MAG: hypothetical protein OXQ89_19015 [Rhodospirillaceae bacterium]|nr:hypothetical protein [Rhodospirillaceae bacterium]